LPPYPYNDMLCARIASATITIMLGALDFDFWPADNRGSDAASASLGADIRSAILIPKITAVVSKSGRTANEKQSRHEGICKWVAAGARFLRRLTNQYNEATTKKSSQVMGSCSACRGHHPPIQCLRKYPLTIRQHARQRKSLARVTAERGHNEPAQVSAAQNNSVQESIVQRIALALAS
jgi:hypothetical protein